MIRSLPLPYTHVNIFSKLFGKTQTINSTTRLFVVVWLRIGSLLLLSPLVDDEMNSNGGGEEGSKQQVVMAVYMCGYLPGVSPEKSPILSPVPARLPIHGGDSWKDVCGGGCGFAMAISGSGKLITWGSADDEGQSYVTSGKHGEIAEAFPLPSEATSVVKAAAGWAHCVSATETGEVYTWGWKECVPSGKIGRDFGASSQKDGNGSSNANVGKQNIPLSEEGSPRSQGGTVSHFDSRNAGEEVAKRRKLSVPKEEFESSATGDDFSTATPSLVSLSPGVRITNVAAGGRHTLVLSDMGQVWGWGYGGEGQLGLGSRVKVVSSPHLIRCIEPPASGNERTFIVYQGSANSSTQASKSPGTYLKGIACGGRHSAVVTDAGALITFGWGLYGQCGQGSTNDQLRPTVVSSLSGVQVEKVAGGLWHTVCTTVNGHVYAFGGNQFGQLGTGAEQSETQPRLLDAPSLEGKRARLVSCGARHSAILTEDGQVFSWGWNKYGQLGLGDSINRNIPSQVSLRDCLPKDVACGWWHTLLLAEPLQ